MNNDDIDLICRLYREAKDKDEQIKILTQMYLRPREDIKDILHARGLLDVDKTMYAKYAKLHSRGASDYQIALACSTKVEDVRYWRVVNKLKPNIYKRKRL